MGVYATEITSNKIISDNPIHQRLLKAYYLAVDYIKGDLLELGCGEGRGVALLAPIADSFTAIDKISEVVDELTQKFPDYTFKRESFPPLDGTESNSFDTIVSFQVIEHITDDRKFLKEIWRVLRPGGKAIITTPNKKKSLTRNPWHIREYTAGELKALADSIFDEVELSGITGNDKVWQYYELNKKSVEKITRFDIFDLQNRLPALLLKIPYEILNRLNRNILKSKNDALVTDILQDDYLLSEDADQSLDLFCIMTKK